MDASKLSTGDKVIVGSGIALFLFSLFPWFTLGGYGAQSGWHFFVTGMVPTGLGVVMVGWVVGTRLADIELPELPAPEALLLLGLAGASAGLILLRLIIGSSVGSGVVSISLDRSFGLFLAVLASFGLVAGAFLRYQEDEAGSSSSGSGDRGGSAF